MHLGGSFFSADHTRADEYAGHFSQEDTGMEDEYKADVESEAWGEKPTPEGTIMLAGWKRSAAKHLKKMAERSPPEDDDYSMHQGDFDVDPLYASSSPSIPFDEASCPSSQHMQHETETVDFDADSNESEEVYCQMLLQLNRENCLLKMQLRQAHRRVRELSSDLDSLRRKYSVDMDSEKSSQAAGANDWFSGKSKSPADWRIGSRKIPIEGFDKIRLHDFDSRSMSTTSSSMPSPSGSMLSSAGTKVDSSEGERKGSLVPLAQSDASAEESTKLARRPQHWSDEEHKRFLQAMKIFGYSSAQDIARYVGTRSVTQVRTHTQKHFLKLCKS